MSNQEQLFEQKYYQLEETYRELQDKLSNSEKELKQNLDHIRNFFLLGSGGRVIFTVNGTIEKANEHYVTGIMAYSEQQIAGRNFFDQIVENDQWMIKEAVKKIASKSIRHHHEVVSMKRNDESTFDASILLSTFTDPSINEKLIFASITNITSQLSMHFELEEKKKLLVEAQKLSQFGYWHYSFSTSKIFWSDEILRIFDLSPKDNFSSLNDLIKHVHEEDQQLVTNFWKKNSTQQAVSEITFRIIVPDGSIRYLTMKAELETDRNKRPVRILGTLIDITENWFREKKLRENEELFHSLFNNLTDIFIIFELERSAEDDVTDYIFKEVNPLFEMKIGISSKEVIGKKLSDKLPSIFQQFNPLLKITAIANQPQQDRVYIPMLDSINDILIYSPNPNMLATIWRDVSLIVEAEGSLRESEEKYRQIFSIASDALLMIDFQTARILECNPTTSLMYGYQRDDLMKMTIMDLSSQPEELRKSLDTQVSKLVNEVCKKADGKKIPVEMSLAYFNWGGRKVIFISVRDVTERIVSQENLIKSEQKFKQLFDFSNDAILILRNYRIIDFNQKAIALFDIKHGSLANKTLWGISPTIQPNGEDSRTNAVEMLEDTLSGNQHQFEWVFQQSDLSTFVADVKLSPILYGNEKVTQVIIRDITPQKETEIALKTSEERWKFALEGSGVGIWDWDLTNNHIYYSPAWKLMLGYQDHEIPNIFDEFEKRVHPDDTIRVFDIINKYIQGQITSYEIAFRMQCKNGSYKWILGRGKIIAHTPDGKPTRFIGSNDDITRSKIQELNLKNEISQLKQTASILKTGYWLLDLRTMVFHCSAETYQLLGFDNEPLHIKKLEKIVHPDDRDVFMNQFTAQTLSRHEKLENFRILINDVVKHIQSYALPQFDKNNTLSGYSGAFQDITLLKSNELEQENQYNIFSTFSNQLHMGILIVQEETVVFANKKAAEITGYTEQEMLTNNFSVAQLFTLEQSESWIKKMSFWQAQKTKNSINEIEIRTRHQRSKWVELIASPMKYNENQALLIAFQDITIRKNKQLSLEQKEAQLLSVAERMDAGVAIYNESKILIFSNSKYNYLAGDNLKSPGNSPFTHKNEKLLFETFETIKNNNQISLPYELKLEVDNEIIWVNYYAYELENNQTLIYLHEIDQVKRDGLTALNDALTLRKVLQETQNAVALFSQSLEMIFSNSQFNKLFNTSQSGQFHLNQLPLVNNQSILEHIKLFINKNNSSGYVQFREYNNLILNISISTIQVDQSPMLAFIISDDTTKENEINQLKSNSEKFQNLISTLPLGLAFIDKNRLISECNEAYINLLGYDSTEIYSKRIDELIFFENLSEFLDNYSQLFSGIKKHFSLRQCMLRKNQQPLWVQSNTYAINDKFGNIISAIHLIEDVSELIKAEQTNTIKERMLTLNTISESMAHLFNNQYMSIFGSAYLLKSITDDPIIETHANNIISSMQQWFNHAGKYLGFAPYNKQLQVIVDSHELIDQFRKSNINLNYPNIQIIYKYESPHGKIIGDPNLLYNALQAVISNALEAIINDGQINISTQDVFFEKDERINGATVLKAGKYLRIRVSDTGKGIKNQHLPFVFDPLYTTKKKPLHPGLGLTLGKLLINQMNGNIKMMSSPEKGTQANIYLPIPDSDKLQGFITPNEQYLMKGTANILIVDDEEVIRLITNHFLQMLGYNVFAFSTGRNALKFYAENKNSIDMAIIDMQMPVMDGEELFNELKKIGPSLKVIMMSGFNLNDKIERLMKNGISAYIQKPVGIEKLSQAIAKVLFMNQNNQ